MVDLPDTRHRVKLIVGLGNPGAKYKGTRHNLGFEVVDEVARRRDLEFTTSPADAVIARETGTKGRLILAKPLTFMNRSGYAVSVLSRYFDVETSNILVVLDDVNLSLGRLRARPDGSDGGHNGLQSVILSLGTKEFSRVRMGVGIHVRIVVILMYLRLLRMGGEIISWSVLNVDGRLPWIFRGLMVGLFDSPKFDLFFDFLNSFLLY